MKHTPHIALVGDGGRRIVDFWLKMGNQIALLEVKYQLPKRAGAALTRLVGQIRTYSTAQEAVRNNAQVVLFTFKAPSNAQMALLEKSLGANAPFVQHVHGFSGLVQWTRFFFTSVP